jgi:hypothetical protein
MEESGSSWVEIAAFQTIYHVNIPQASGLYLELARFPSLPS